MDFTSRHDLQFSRLMLGTVQFGMPYGVANRSGQPDYAAVRSIVKTALSAGVNCFDTAAEYGSSEEVLGRALRELGAANDAVVVTKVRALSADEVADEARASQAIQQSVAESRRRLGIECLPVVLFHRESDSVYLPILDSLHRRGWLQCCGVSCDNRAGGAEQLVANEQVAALQLPGNLLDGRHLKSGILDQAARGSVAIFIRSAFLQGLLLMPEAEIPPALQDVIPVRRALQRIADGGGMSMAELSIRYVLSLNGVTSVVVGVETETQMRDNLNLITRGPLTADTLSAIHQAVPPLEEMVITPSQWPV